MHGSKQVAQCGAIMHITTDMARTFHRPQLTRRHAPTGQDIFSQGFILPQHTLKTYGMHAVILSCWASRRLRRGFDFSYGHQFLLVASAGVLMYVWNHVSPAK